MATVLIVEDEPLIAEMIEEHLREAGFEIAGVAGSVEKALAMVEACHFEVAVLDVNLRGRSAQPVAMALHARGTPFLFLSGYGRVYLPEDFLTAPLLSKPFLHKDLISAVRSVLQQK